MRSVFNLINFLKGAVSELHNVAWPSKQEIYVFSALVFVMLLIFAVFFVCVDSFIALIVSWLLR